MLKGYRNQLEKALHAENWDNWSNKIIIVMHYTPYNKNK